MQGKEDAAATLYRSSGIIEELTKCCRMKLGFETEVSYFQLYLTDIPYNKRGQVDRKDRNLFRAPSCFDIGQNCRTFLQFGLFYLSCFPLGISFLKRFLKAFRT